jgi:hypothetical protein
MCCLNLSSYFLLALILWVSPNQDASDLVLGVFGKLSMRREVHGLGSMSFGLGGAKVLEY